MSVKLRIKFGMILLPLGINEGNKYPEETRTQKEKKRKENFYGKKVRPTL